ncbi:DUF2536 family protein [Paenibacillus allorhizosphaerae]|uniref:DUF2536 family protein n=1 Tax=Paenibacillus allorhizosphaerae TaxID=2849866 RepID=A0ABN7TQN4_9BACL|nr:DUF2536 family protein [Paenibacillus allorhizosphaerae]CAG7643451.1 hypothetical protein PAECIP111802_03021 [Paenibacillus allorhizosphaerae]
MEFILDKIDTKIEWFEAYDLKTLEKKIEERIEINKGILLDVHSVQHQVAFNPNMNKMLYTAVVHFRAK